MTTSRKITAYVMTKNEEHSIAQCIDALKWCDEIIVADTGSKDRTRQIAAARGCRVLETPFEGFGRTRNSIIDQIDSEWIVCFDADEVCTPELAEEIIAAIQSGEADAYLANRRTYLLGRQVKHSGWNPDYRHAVAFKKSSYRYTERPVHESYICEGKVTKLKSSFDHYSFPNLSTLMEKEKTYALLGARTMLKEGKKSSMGKAFFHGAFAFFRHFVLRSGFLDGWCGFVIAISAAHSTFFRYAMVYESEKQTNK